MHKGRWFAGLIVFVLILSPTSVFGQEGLLVSASTTAVCGEASFEVTVDGGTSPYSFDWFFGDGETLAEEDIFAMPHLTTHIYPGQGTYAWSLSVTDSGDPMAEGMAEGTIDIGPTVSLSSDTFPPIYMLEGGQATATFSAEVSGGQAPYAYEWTFDGAADLAVDEASASATYTAAGKYLATVTVTDDCGFSHTDTLTIVVFDPEEACHPRAEQIAEAVSSLFPGQAEQLYSCEDIYDFFRGGLTGSQLGFGQMWQAYKLALVIEELTWEEILDWKLEVTGWGLLKQLDRFAETVDEVGIADLVGRVISGESSIRDIRSAIRLVTRFEADFEDALDRLEAGTSAGDLAKLYRASQDLEMDMDVLQGYLAMGLTLSDLNHAAKLAEQTGADWAEVVSAHATGHSWGEIKQAYRLADDETSAEAILESGVQDYRRQEREEAREERRSERESDQDARTAEKLAQQYGVTVDEVMSMYESCGQDWKCVRDYYKDLAREAREAERGGRRGSGGD